MKLKFLATTEPYTEGDVVDFPEDRAQDLIRQGIAVEADEKAVLKIQAEEKSKERAENKSVDSGNAENKSI
jgi:hypothetical protein